MVQETNDGRTPNSYQNVPLDSSNDLLTTHTTRYSRLATGLGGARGGLSNYHSSELLLHGRRRHSSGPAGVWRSGCDLDSRCVDSGLHFLMTLTSAGASGRLRFECCAAATHRAVQETGDDQF